MCLLFVVTTALCIFFYFVMRRFDHPAFLFTAIWSFIFLLLLLQLYEIPISVKVIDILIVMIIAFPLGSYFCTAKKQRRIHNSNVVNSLGNSGLGYQVTLRKKAFWAICLFSIVIMFIDEVTTIATIARGASFLDIIESTGSVNTVEMSGYKALLYVFVIYPATYFVSPICAIEVLSNNSRKVPYIALNFVMIFLSVMHHGARLMIIVAILVYIFALYIFDKRVHVSKTMKRILAIAIVFAIIAIVWLSSSRGIEKVWDSFYIYFVCEIPVLENILNSNIYSGHTLGFLSFNGIMYPVFTLLRLIGIPSPNLYSYTQTIRKFLEADWIYLSTYGHNVNAFLPAGGYLYIDGGYIGEFIGMFLTGYMCQSIHHKMLAKRDFKTISIYLLLIVSILLSFFRYYGNSYQFVIALVYLLFLYSKQSKCKIKD